MDTSSPSVPHPSRLLRLVLFSLLLGTLGFLLLLGVYLILLMPIWIAPPNLVSSPWLYLPVVYGWLIVLIVLALTRRITVTRGAKIFAAIIAVIEGLLFIAFALLFSLGTFSCNPAPSTDGLVHYDCKETIQGFAPATDSGGMSTIKYKFQGWQGWPIVVEDRSQNR